MAISHLFPEEGPTLNLNFAGSRTLDPRITFTRTQTTSNGSTYMGRDGLIKYAGPDEPRFDHRYVNGEIESLGLLVEEQRTNLILYSNDFSQSNWTKQNSHPTPSKNAIGPDGVANSASTVYRTATNQYLFQSILGGGTYTLSAWVKSEAATGSFFMQAYNVTDGTMGQVTYTATNEWQRFETTISPTTNTSYYPCIPTNTNTNFYVWGVQVESGSFKTSYIPTEGSTITRTKDVAYIDGSNFTEWFNINEGTFFINHKWDGFSASYDPLFAVSTNGGGSGINLWNVDSGTGLEYPATSNYAKITTSSFSKYGLTYNTSSRATILNGGSVVEDANGFTSLSTANRLSIGSERVLTVNGVKTIQQLTYYPVRLSNSQLQTLTR